jgi:hypothetical protein
VYAEGREGFCVSFKCALQRENSDGERVGGFCFAGHVVVVCLFY